LEIGFFAMKNCRLATSLDSFDREKQRKRLREKSTAELIIRHVRLEFPQMKINDIPLSED
jgi:hypothetical protein